MSHFISSGGIRSLTFKSNPGFARLSLMLEKEVRCFITYFFGTPVLPTPGFRLLGTILPCGEVV
jgi:hypothetical protein